MAKRHIVLMLKNAYFAEVGKLSTGGLNLLSICNASATDSRNRLRLTTFTTLVHHELCFR